MPRKTNRKIGKLKGRYTPSLTKDFSHIAHINSDIVLETFWDSWNEHRDGIRQGMLNSFHKNHKRDKKWVKKNAIRMAVTLKRKYEISAKAGLPSNPPKFYIHPKPKTNK